MSSKKGKKTKGKTLALVDFLQDTPGVVPQLPVRKSNSNWADEVEDFNDGYETRLKAPVVLPTAPKASLDFDDIDNQVPHNPPFKAYLTNLPYDVDEDEIASLFKSLRIANMTIPKDDRSGDIPRLRGFGYIEFEDRDSLLSALILPDLTLKNRRIRIEIPPENDDKRRMNRMDMNRDRSNRSDSMGDWRSGPRTENTENERRSYRNDRERDRDKDRDDTPGAWREGERDFGRNDRYGRDRDRDRDDRYRSDDRDRDRDRYRNSDKDDRFGSGRRYDDRNRPFTRREDSEPRSEPRQRPKLVLAPRTKPIETAPETSAPTASIFGAAKPVDTSARERQIEERLARQHDEQKKEVAPSSGPPSGSAPFRRNTDRYHSSSAREHDRHDDDNYDKRSDASNEDVHTESRAETVAEDRKEVVKSPTPSHEDNHRDNKNKETLAKKLSDPDKKTTPKIVAKNDNASNKQPNKNIEKVKREEKRNKTEKAMPTVKKTDPPNFIGSNKFEFLENEDISD